MKRVLIIIVFCFASYTLQCQVYRIHQEYCKKKEMEIISGASIPKGYAVMQRGYFDKEDVQGTLEGLTKKQIKKMKTYCHWRHCCKVFIAFKPIETYENNDPGLDFWSKKINFYVLAPIWELDCK